MTGFLIRIAIIAFSLWVATLLLDGVRYHSLSGLFWAAFWLGIINATVRPLSILLTLPLTIVTLGLFLLVINAGMLGLAAWLIDDFSVDGFGSALMGALLVSIISTITSWFIGEDGRFEVIVQERRVRNDD